ncbi:T9SS type A sorting domain-containing protein [Polaribacter sp. WD7]|uniref:T9SS type A sorting domain-containing protein n=1 Tax=Polaribacter sp. WD7 TaxID=2269061 RepID=UPI0021622087|nr:T9SS type A sorting domain-containing protein [Polaribacter sp. WD7]
MLSLQNKDFKMSSYKSIKYQVNIFNVLGLKTETEIFFVKEIELDLPHYPSGIYFINLKSENNRFKKIKK